MDKLEAFDEINCAIEISYATLKLISEHQDIEGDSWAIIGVLEQIEKVKDCLTIIGENLQKEEF